MKFVINRIIILTMVGFLSSSCYFLSKREIKNDAIKTIEKVKTTSKKIIVNIKKNQKITSPLEVKVNSNGVWFANEGELGTVTIYDENGKQLGNVGILSVDGTIDWMTEKPVPFKTEIIFNKKQHKKGKLIIKNNNPSEGKVKEFILPIVF